MSKNNEFDITLNQFRDYLSTILKVYQDLIPVLKSELEAVQKDDIDSLNECLKSQQALLILTRNFDTKIDEYQTKLNITAANLSELILKLPDDKQLTFFEILSQFGQTSAEVRFYQEKCRLLLQSKLYLIDKVLSKTKIPKDNITYNKDAAEVQGSLFSKALEIKI
jgi:FlgN protein.